MKFLKTAFFLFMVLCLPLCAQEIQSEKSSITIYPGNILISHTGWDGEIFSHGYGASASIGASLGPLSRLDLSLSAIYRWLEIENGSQKIQPLPGVRLSISWKLPAIGPLSVSPGIGISYPIDVFGLVKGSVRISDRNFVTLTAKGIISLDNNTVLPFFHPSLSLGIRHETPWMLPIPEIKPVIVAYPSLFSPDGDGENEFTELLLKAKKPRSIHKWFLTILNSEGLEFKHFSGTGMPPDKIRWEGFSDTGTEAEPAFDYQCIFETTDILGKTSRSTTMVTVDILVIKDGDRYVIKVPPIIFPSYSSNLKEEKSAEFLRENRATLERIALLFSRFPDYTLTVEGHANSVLWNNPATQKKEQNEVLIPLSKARADNVRDALMLLGINADRIQAIGIGGDRPLVPFNDTENIWKNRRVEFILSK